MGGGKNCNESVLISRCLWKNLRSLRCFSTDGFC